MVKFKFTHALLFTLMLMLVMVSSAVAEVTPFTVWTDSARADLPQWVQYWLYFMFMMAGLGLIFVWKHVGARWGVGAFVVSHLFSAAELLTFGADNFLVGMIAINHAVVWTPALVMMALHLKKVNLRSPYGVWLVGMCGTFAFSLVFDYCDAFIYLFTQGP